MRTIFFVKDPANHFKMFNVKPETSHLIKFSLKIYYKVMYI